MVAEVAGAVKLMLEEAVHWHLTTLSPCLSCKGRGVRCYDAGGADE